jgi:multiple sugar transport system permease protein
MPMMVAGVAAGLMWRYLLHEQLGILNIIIQSIGFAAVNFRSDPHLAMPTVIACDVWQWTPFMFLLMLAGLQSLPRAPFEAATIDGASSSQIFRYVTLQLLKPVILIALLLRTIDAIKTFDIIYTLTGGGPGTITEVITYDIYRLGFWFYNLGKAAALSYVLLIIISVLCYLMIRQLRRR